MQSVSFSLDHGFLDAVCRGFRKGVLTTSEYSQLVQCEDLEDLKLHLASTSWGTFLSSETSKLSTSVIAKRCVGKLTQQYNHLRAQCLSPLDRFLDYIVYGHQIDNIILLIMGTLHDRPIAQLLEKCHPLGTFPNMARLAACETPTDLYHTVLVDTPLAPYFLACDLNDQDFDERNIEVIRSTLYKEYLEDFYKYCTKTIGGTTGEVMGELLQFEADRRCINITINSLKTTELQKDERKELFPTVGHLHPEGLELLANADDEDQVRVAVEKFESYRRLFDKIIAGGDRLLDDVFAEEEIRLCIKAFEQQFHFGVFYAYFKLKEAEIRNILYISECILQNVQEKINNFLPIF